MKYLSVCSGIEAASVAWGPLGWEPVAFSEIEKFPCALLAYRFPNVPNLGNMLDYEKWNIGAIDLLVGGTPCQAFSVAGKRKSLDDERGNLCITFCKIADKFDPEWVLWENVPGVLNTKDHAFGCFLGELCGAGRALHPDEFGGRFPNYGVVSGEKRTVAWRVLDAQWFGVAQRRRRVFVLAVRGAGNFKCADALLPVGESVPGNPAEGRKARKEVAPHAGRSPQKSHWDGGPHPTIDARKSGVGMSDQELFAQGGAFLVPGVCFTFNDAGRDATTNGICPTLRAGSGGGPVVPAVAYNAHGFSQYREDDKAQPLRTNGFRPDVVCVTCVPIDMRNATRRPEEITSGTGIGNEGDPCFTLTAGGNMPLVSYSIQGNIIRRKDKNGGNGCGLAKEISGTLTSCDRHAVVAVSDVCPTLTSTDLAEQAGQGLGSGVCAIHNSFVRRLTPRECERLQGFPDDWTLIPYFNPFGCYIRPEKLRLDYQKYLQRGGEGSFDDVMGVTSSSKMAGNSVRYKAIGNSKAIPPVQWIGRQIEKVSKRGKEVAA